LLEYEGILMELEYALSLYDDKKISFSRAAEMCGLTVADLLAHFSEQNINLNYDIGYRKPCDKKF
jgi:predicted HTH domain antitoxin